MCLPSVPSVLTVCYSSRVRVFSVLIKAWSAHGFGQLGGTGTPGEGDGGGEHHAHYSFLCVGCPFPLFGGIYLSSVLCWRHVDNNCCCVKSYSSSLSALRCVYPVRRNLLCSISSFFCFCRWSCAQEGCWCEQQEVGSQASPKGLTKECSFDAFGLSRQVNFALLADLKCNFFKHFMLKFNKREIGVYIRYSLRSVRYGSPRKIRAVQAPE